MSSFQRVRPLAHKRAVSRPVEATRVGRERDRELARRPHGSATTTPSIREAIQASSEKNTVLATQMRPKNPRSLTLNDEVIIVAYRWRTRLSLDESHVRLRRLMPQLSRSALYRCLERYGLSKIGRTNIS
jgi:hypothetical protein